jgi:hypothetical protein
VVIINLHGRDDLEGIIKGITAPASSSSSSVTERQDGISDEGEQQVEAKQPNGV